MRNLTLLTDLYELTMAYGFYRHKKHEGREPYSISFSARISSSRILWRRGFNRRWTIC